MTTEAKTPSRTMGCTTVVLSHVAACASVPQNATNPVDSLPLYVSLFPKLGLGAVVGTVIAAAVIPTMRRRSAVSGGWWEAAA